MRRGVIVKTVINGMVFDGATKDPMQMAMRDALIGFMAAMAQASAEATKDAQRAGIRHAKAVEGQLPRTQAELHVGPACGRAGHARRPVRYRRDLRRDRTLAPGRLSDPGGPGMGGRAACALGEGRLTVRLGPRQSGFSPARLRRARVLPFAVVRGGRGARPVRSGCRGGRVLERDRLLAALGLHPASPILSSLLFRFGDCLRCELGSASRVAGWLSIAVSLESSLLDLVNMIFDFGL